MAPTSEKAALHKARARLSIQTRRYLFWTIILIPLGVNGSDLSVGAFTRHESWCSRQIFNDGAYRDLDGSEATTTECAAKCLAEVDPQRGRCTGFRYDLQFNTCDVLWFRYNCHQPAFTYEEGDPPKLPPSFINWGQGPDTLLRFHQYTTWIGCDIYGLPFGLGSFNGRYAYSAENNHFEGPAGALFRRSTSRGVDTWGIFGSEGSAILSCASSSALEDIVVSTCRGYVSGQWLPAPDVTFQCEWPREGLDPNKKGSWRVGLALELLHFLLMFLLYLLPPVVLNMHKKPDRNIGLCLMVCTGGFWYAWWILQISWSPFLHTDAWILNAIAMFGLCSLGAFACKAPLTFWVWTYGRCANRKRRLGYKALAAIISFRGLRLRDLENALMAGADLSTRWKGRTIWHLAREKLPPSSEQKALASIERLRPIEADWMRLQAHDVKGFKDAMRGKSVPIPEGDFRKETPDPTGRSKLHLAVLTCKGRKLRLRFALDLEGAPEVSDVLAYMLSSQKFEMFDDLRNLGHGSSESKTRPQLYILDVVDVSRVSLEGARNQLIALRISKCGNQHDTALRKSFCELLSKARLVKAAGVMLVGWSECLQRVFADETVKDKIRSVEVPVLKVLLEMQAQDIEIAGQQYTFSIGKDNHKLALGHASFGQSLRISQSLLNAQEPYAAIVKRGSIPEHVHACRAADLGALAVIVCDIQGEDEVEEEYASTNCCGREPTAPAPVPVWFVEGNAADALWKEVNEKQIVNAILPRAQPLEWLVESNSNADRDNVVETRIRLDLCRTEAHWIVTECGVPVNLTDDEGNTALHLAAWYADHEHIRELLSLGANRSLVNKNGLTPWQLALSSTSDSRRSPAALSLYRKETERTSTWYCHLGLKRLALAIKYVLYLLAAPFVVTLFILALPCAPLALWLRRDAVCRWIHKKCDDSQRLIKGLASPATQKTIELLRATVRFEDLDEAACQQPGDSEYDEPQTDVIEELARARRMLTLALGDNSKHLFVKDSTGDNVPDVADGLQLRSLLAEEIAASRAGSEHPEASKLQTETLSMAWLFPVLAFTYVTLFVEDLRLALGPRGISLILVCGLIVPCGIHMIAQQHPFTIWLWRGRHERARTRRTVKALISHAKVLLRLAGEQRLYNEAEGPKYRQWLRYLLEALVPLDSSGQLREVATRADDSVNAAYQAVFEDPHNAALKDPSIPREALVNRAQEWQGFHQAHAHGTEGLAGMLNRDVVQFAQSLFEVNAFQTVEELSHWAATASGESVESFFKEGYNVWLLGCARLADVWLEEEMVKRFGRFGKDGGKYKKAPLKLLERAKVKSSAWQAQEGDDVAMIVGGMCDLTRCSLTFDTAEELLQAYEEMRCWTMEKVGMESIRVTWDYHDPAARYKDAKVLLLIPVPGTRFQHIAECQLLLRAALEIKVHSHLIYQVNRGDLDGPQEADGTRRQGSWLGRLLSRRADDRNLLRPLLPEEDSTADRSSPSSGSGVAQRDAEPTLYGQRADAV